MSFMDGSIQVYGIHLKAQSVVKDVGRKFSREEATKKKTEN